MLVAASWGEPYWLTEILDEQGRELAASKPAGPRVGPAIREEPAGKRPAPRGAPDPPGPVCHGPSGLGRNRVSHHPVLYC